MKKTVYKILLLTVILLFVCLIRAENEDEIKIGLVLSGGGARGLAHIGAIKVLEKYGITPDYITGTSMGSIIGSLYSLGYTAEEMEDLVLSQDWDELLFDYIPLNRIALEEKKEKGRYAGSFPIENYKVKLPKGLVAGQNVSQLLSKLTICAHQVEDFKNLPIPFLCIATDIETGEAVVLDKGYLPEAVRASMSIPSMFTPVEYEGKLLVDGGLVRNFPVSDCISLGANFIIGVDVGSGLHNRDELNSLVKVMEQSVAFQGAKSTREERKKTDILITPDVDDFNITEFNKAAELILLGEKAALEIEEDVLKLKETYTPNQRKIPLANPDILFIEDIKIEGLSKVSKNLIIGKMGFKEGNWVSIDEIDSTISQLYGSGYFERVIYKLEWGNSGYVLRIKVWEKNTWLFRFGLHYDSDHRAAVLLNMAFRNKVLAGSKVSIDLQLGDTRYFRWAEFVHTGWRPGFGLGWDVFYDKFRFVYRDSEGEKQASLNIRNTGSEIKLTTIFSQNLAAEASVIALKINTKGDIVPEEWGNLDEESLWLNNAFRVKVDNRDRSVYPTRGLRLFLELKNYFCLEEDYESDKRFLRLFLDGELYIPLNSRLTMSAGGFLGAFNTENVPNEEVFYAGGLTAKDNGRPFVGYNFAEVAAEQLQIGRLKLQYEPWNSKYFLIRYDLGRVIRNFKGFEAQDFTMQGWGISFGMATPIGPIEWTLMGTDQKKDDIRSFIKVGYNFLD